MCDAMCIHIDTWVYTLRAWSHLTVERLLVLVLVDEAVDCKAAAYERS